MRDIVLIAHNLRSCHNVGSLLRTAEGLGVSRVFLTGYTPFPLRQGDARLPHLAQKVHKQIHKTALGAEDVQPWQNEESIDVVITQLQKDGYQVVGLEQTPQSISLPEFKPSQKNAIILGREVEGLELEVQKMCTDLIEIPMYGHKESFNVVQAAAMALYHCRFYGL